MKTSLLCLTISLLLASQATAAVPHQRQFQYRPDGDAWVCVNGVNRYTRGLYGNHTAYRIDTSDRPVFAATNGKVGYNIQFRLTLDGQTLSLDSTDYCEARYVPGRRDYVVRDMRWGKGELQVSILAYPDREGAVWKVSAQGFADDVTVDARLCHSRAQKLIRFGDLGKFEEPGYFEAPEHPEYTSTAQVTLNNSTGYIGVEQYVLGNADNEQLAQEYARAEAARMALVSNVTFSTPDKYITPVGSAMVYAADGAWDEKVWLHGAVGWYTRLPGWRAAYMGDFLGWPDRARTHFTAYGKSQVTDEPVTKPHMMDAENNLARGTYEWGTPVYSNGYICRSPENNHQFNHYDMNLNYIDELLWHFEFDADTTYMRQMWPVLVRHLAWEKNAFDPDNDHLYDAYCCIWASDALQYNSGAGTHPSAYNYRGNLLAARIAELIGEDPTPYRTEAEAILQAMNSRLWLKGNAAEPGHWAEFQDFMGAKMIHPSAAVWSIYTPVDCGSCTPEQAYEATRYIDQHIPHITFAADGETYETISTSDWLPYEWSINNVCMAEVMHTALAYWEAGRSDEAYRLLKGTVMDFMYLGQSPANFGQVSHEDAILGEEYRDFADVTGISSRAFISGLYGIIPDALQGRCIIRPGFPSDWNSASIHTPYLDYSFERRDGKDIYKIHQNFPQPLQIVLRQNKGMGQYCDIVSSSDIDQTIVCESVSAKEESTSQSCGKALVEGNGTSQTCNSVSQGCNFDDVRAANCRMINMDKVLNANVTDIFGENKYLSPRSPYTTLCLPAQGIGDWCSTKRMAVINDAPLRELAKGNVFTAAGIPFRTLQQGQNIAYTSLWDNYPDSVSIPLSGKASHAYLMMTGSTNPMQSRITNGILCVEYTDGSRDTLTLRNPDNWCPIEQDYQNDSLAFCLPNPRPFRIGLASGMVSRTLSQDLRVEAFAGACDIPELKRPVYYIEGGAAQLIDMPLRADKKLKSLTVKTIANDVVIGVMSITLQRP